jgi:hypothetical protein
MAQAATAVVPAHNEGHATALMRVWAVFRCQPGGTHDAVGDLYSRRRRRRSGSAPVAAAAAAAAPPTGDDAQAVVAQASYGWNGCDWEELGFQNSYVSAAQIAQWGRRSVSGRPSMRQIDRRIGGTGAGGDNGTGKI